MNGDLVASAEAAFGDDEALLQVETVIPRPPEPAGPDSLESEGTPRLDPAR